MNIVIDIPEEMYKWVNDVNKFFDDYGTSDFVELIKNGTLLPKGHGDLIDRSTIDMSSEYRNVNLTDKSLWIANGILNNSKVVIPADKDGDAE